MLTPLITLTFFATLGLLVLLAIVLVKFSSQQRQLQQLIEQNKNFGALLLRLDERSQQQNELRNAILKLLADNQAEQQQQRERFDQHQIKSLTTIQESLQQAVLQLNQQVNNSLSQYVKNLDASMEKLSKTTDQRLFEISGQVEKRLSEGFEKTTKTFTDVVKRLAEIDIAQKKIIELSSDVVSLQQILNDKRSRGVLGEVQLNTLIRNVLPENCFAFQYTLANDKRCDCILFLPEPTGHVVIDAKFPLENYQNFMREEITESERNHFKQQFRQDIKKHIKDIAEKYIIPGKTADGAVMFIPAEAIFAEIHANFPDLVQTAYQAHVWLVSPTTMMAILTTARAVLKDEATRKQVHIIQTHLSALGKDFSRFQDRMDDLSRHIQQVNSDVEKIHSSSKKISSRFEKIENVELANSMEKLEVLAPEE